MIGGTGAIGQHVVTQLCNSSAWETVTCLVRNPMNLEDQYKKCVVEKVVGSDGFEAALSDSLHYEGQNAVFCTLGTTRGVAGSGENFYKIDHDYVKLAADTAGQSGVKHFSLVTAQGAKDVWKPWDIAILHPILYMKTKWDAEQSTIAANIPSTAIFRPGLLDRGAMAEGRALEDFARKFTNGIPVEDVARAMILKAEENKEGVIYYEDAEIRTLAQSVSSNSNNEL